MRFLGIDLAWGNVNSTAAVALDWNSGTGILTAAGWDWSLQSDQDILDFTHRWDDGSGLILGVDAPLDVPNERGERPVEAALRRCFGKFQAGAHPANRTLFGGEVRGERLAARWKAEQNIDSGLPSPPRCMPARICWEVFPHPAHIVLFGLSRTLKYKSRAGRDYDSRYEQYDRYLEGLHSLADGEPSLAFPDWLASPRGLIGGALKRYEDRIDALTCAYVAAYHWYWGESEYSMMVGSKTEGYIVTPILPEHRACLENSLKKAPRTS